jgi:hypothetical protein
VNPSGHVRLFRKLQFHPVWTQLSPAVLKVQLYVVMNANWKPTKWYDGDQEVLVPVGSFVSSHMEICEACRLSSKQVRDALTDLSVLQVTRVVPIRAPGRAHHKSLITVLNYKRYQISEDAEGQAIGQANGAKSGKRWASDGQANEIELPQNGTKPNGIIETATLAGMPLKEEDLKTERIEDSRPPKDGAIAFLKAYPVKVAQEQAVRAYLSRIDTMADHLQLMDGLAKHMVSSLWLDANGNLMLDEIARFYRPDTFIFTGKYKDSPPPAGGFGSSSKRIVNL